MAYPEDSTFRGFEPLKNPCIFRRAMQCTLLGIIFGINALYAGHLPPYDPEAPLVPRIARNLGRQRVVAEAPAPEALIAAPVPQIPARFMGRIDRPGNRNNPSAERKQ